MAHDAGDAGYGVQSQAARGWGAADGIMADEEAGEVGLTRPHQPPPHPTPQPKHTLPSPLSPRPPDEESTSQPCPPHPLTMMPFRSTSCSRVLPATSSWRALT